MPTLQKPSKQKSRTFNREDRQKIYQSAKWKKLREAKLMSNPLCQICLQRGIIKSSEDIHHADSFMNYTGNMRLQKAYDFDNLISVCKSCHSFLHNEGTTNGIDIETVAKRIEEYEKGNNKL